MPLYHGKSKRDFSHNVRTEYEEGKPLKQSLAIAYALKKKGRKMNEGGETEWERTEQESGRPSRPSIEDRREREEEKPGYMAKGGEVCHMCAGGSCPKHMTDGGEVRGRKWSDMGREIEPSHEYPEEREVEDDDMVTRIMKKRRYSEGGRVANEDHGPRDSRLAGFEQNEFDDLALRDDLEDSDTGRNSGDEIGDRREDKDNRDIVSRIMESRKLKNRMPIPGYGISYGRSK